MELSFKANPKRVQSRGSMPDRQSYFSSLKMARLFVSVSSHKNTANFF